MQENAVLDTYLYTLYRKFRLAVEKAGIFPLRGCLGLGQRRVRSKENLQGILCWHISSPCLYVKHLGFAARVAASGLSRAIAWKVSPPLESSPRFCQRCLARTGFLTVKGAERGGGGKSKALIDVSPSKKCIAFVLEIAGWWLVVISPDFQQF